MRLHLTTTTFAALGIVALILTVALPAPVEADTTPTPGYVRAKNDVVVLPDGSCDGNTSIRYRMTTVDTAFALRVTQLANCTMLVQSQELGDPFSYAGGAVMKVLVPYFTGATFMANTTLAWNPLQGPCPSYENADAWEQLAYYSTGGVPIRAESRTGGSCGVWYNTTWETVDLWYDWGTVWAHTGMDNSGDSVCYGALATWSGNTQGRYDCLYYPVGADPSIDPSGFQDLLYIVVGQTGVIQLPGHGV